MRFVYLFISLAVLCWIGFFKAPHKSKIYDCFLFFNELELLDVRLHEMYDHVDKFVIVEATETFRGKPKALFFAENRHLFEKFADKIIHVVVDEKFDRDDPWRRERFQRQQVMRGLKQCRDSDIILLSDLDEIVRGEKIKEMAHLITSKKVEAVICHQRMYQGYLNRYEDVWNGTVCMSYKKFKNIPIKLARRLRNITHRTLRRAKISKVHCMEDAGWHFTSMGGAARYVTKLESFSHAEMDRPGFDKIQHLSDKISPLPIVEIDSSFPLYIQEKREHFEKIGFIETQS